MTKNNFLKSFQQEKRRRLEFKIVVTYNRIKPNMWDLSRHRFESIGECGARIIDL